VLGSEPIHGSIPLCGTFGPGDLLNLPTNQQTTVQLSTLMMFNYGFGIDFLALFGCQPVSLEFISKTSQVTQDLTWNSTTGYFNSLYSYVKEQEAPYYHVNNSFTDGATYGSLISNSSLNFTVLEGNGYASSQTLEQFNYNESKFLVSSQTCYEDQEGCYEETSSSKFYYNSIKSPDMVTTIVVSGIVSSNETTQYRLDQFGRIYFIKSTFYNGSLVLNYYLNYANDINTTLANFKVTRDPNVLLNEMIFKYDSNQRISEVICPRPAPAYSYNFSYNEEGQLTRIKQTFILDGSNPANLYFYYNDSSSQQ